MEKLPVIILGTGLEATIAADLLIANNIIVYGFLSELKSEETEVTEIINIPVTGFWEDKPFQKMLKNEKIDYFVAVSDQNLRAKMLKSLFEWTQKNPINVFHPQIYLSQNASYAGGNLIQGFTNISFGVTMEHCNVIGSNVNIDSNASIGSFNQISSGVTIGSESIISDHVFIGHGAVIHPKVKIESNSLIAAGSVVMRNVKKGDTVFGNPAVSTTSLK